MAISKLFLRSAVRRHGPGSTENSRLLFARGFV
jgi:hypothetical protein